jgi:pyruvate ferredoxin oxidoreductase gamma subunit
MKFNQDILNIVFFARGGQGAKSATEILAQAGVFEGKFVKAFPDFGPERSGAPIKTYLRISEKEIRTAEPILKPDIAVVLDETVLESDKVSGSFDLDGESIAIINSRKSPTDLKNLIPKFKGKIYTIDATGISLKTIGKPTPNVAIIGYLLKITEVVKLSDVVQVFRSIFTEKIGADLTNKNISAMEESYDHI